MNWSGLIVRCWGVEGSLLWAYCSHSSLTSQSGVLGLGRIGGEVVETRREQVEMAEVNLGFRFQRLGTLEMRENPKLTKSKEIHQLPTS